MSEQELRVKASTKFIERIAKHPHVSSPHIATKLPGISVYRDWYLLKAC
jgi:hypothetical protein